MLETIEQICFGVITCAIIIAVVITILGQMQPAIEASSTNEAETLKDVTSQVMGIFPLIIVVIIFTTIILVVSFSFPGENNLIGVEIKPEKEKPHKQTYEEYVQERLNVERMLKHSSGAM